MDQLFDEIEALCEAAVVSAFVKGTIPARKVKARPAEDLEAGLGTSRV